MGKIIESKNPCPRDLLMKLHKEGSEQHKHSERHKQKKVEVDSSVWKGKESWVVIGRETRWTSESV